MKKQTTSPTLSIYDLVLFVIALIGIFNIFLLAVKKFYPVLPLSLAFFVCSLVIFLLEKYKYELAKFTFDKKLLVILFIAVILRLPQSLYLMGGQDQGTYVNISHQYEKNHRLYVIDEFRQSLTQAQQEIYDKYGNYIMPSIEKWNRPESEYSMVFYPLHPSFMSIFGSILGSDNRLYSVSFFSVISLINIYLIVYYLTSNKNISYLAVFLMSINPVHVFFSKFPVGEVTALAFSTAGFYLLIKYLTLKKYELKNIILLILSLLMFFNFMMAKMTFFLYLPILVMICGYAYIKTSDKKQKYIMAGYISAGITFSVISLLYYRLFLYPLYLLIFSGSIKRSVMQLILNKNLWYILITIVFAPVIYFARRNLLKKINYNKLFHILLNILVVLAVSFLIKQAIIDFNNLNSGLKLGFIRWNLLNKGWDGIKYIPLFSAFNYVSYFTVFMIVVFYFLNLFKFKSLKYSFLIFIAFYFLYFVTYKLGFNRYDYYNSRYYLTEIIPIFMIVISISFYEFVKINKITKLFSNILLACIFIYFLIFTFFQFRRYEGPDPLFFKYLDSKITNNSLLIFVNKNMYDSKYEVNYNLYVAGPFKYYFDKKVIVIDDPETLENEDLKSLISSFEDVYYLSNMPLAVSNLSDEEKLSLNYYHFNNFVGCNYHNYEFLKISKIEQIDIGTYFKCKLLPNAYYTRARNFYFGKL